MTIPEKINNENIKTITIYELLELFYKETDEHDLLLQTVFIAHKFDLIIPDSWWDDLTESPITPWNFIKEIFYYDVICPEFSKIITMSNRIYNLVDSSNDEGLNYCLPFGENGYFEVLEIYYNYYKNDANIKEQILESKNKHLIEIMNENLK